MRKNTDARARGGAARNSEESLVMREERRGGVVRSSKVANPQAGMSNRTSTKPYVIAKRAVWDMSRSTIQTAQNRVTAQYSGSQEASWRERAVENGPKCVVIRKKRNFRRAWLKSSRRRSGSGANTISAMTRPNTSWSRHAGV